MSDFIFSTNRIKKNIVTQEIHSIYQENYPEVYEYHGEWGSAGVSVNPYNGFLPYENEKFIIFVVGGPLLMFHDNVFLNEKDSNEGTKYIFERWQAESLNFETDLSGPFAILIVNKKTSEVMCITDLMSFIPVYKINDETGFYLGTHVDMLANITFQNENLDDVSIADFILHGITTYPYTMYQNIFQVAPASIHKLQKNTSNLDTVHYWLPEEETKYKSVNEAAKELSKSLKSFVTKITNETDEIAQFLSGGEDSRMLSGLLRGHEREGHIFLDSINREGKIALKVAEKYDVNLKVTTRDPMHYFNILPSCSALVGSGSQYHHAHTYGFHKNAKLNDFTAVFGGLLADALLKGFRIKKIRGSKRFPFIPDIKNNNSNMKIDTNMFNENILQAINERQHSHLNRIKDFREDSAEEWCNLWPISMNSSSPNIHANRRLFRSYEPFTSSEIVKLSASVPQEWKLNRKLFNKAAKPYLKPSKWLMHSKGFFPYYSWKPNILFQFVTWFYRKSSEKSGLIKGNQGPWGDWKKMIQSDEWDYFICSHQKAIDKIPFKDKKKQLTELISNKDLKVNQYVNLSQVLYEINKNNS